MKIFIVTLAFIASFNVFSQSTNKLNVSAKSYIQNFYKTYLSGQGFNDQNKAEIVFSKSFQELAELNGKLCNEKAGEDICGWNVHGNIYLDAQEYDIKLTYKKAKPIFEETKNNRVKVKLNVLGKKDPAYNREITYALIKEANFWVVDDVIYKTTSLRKMTEEENAELQKKK